MAGRPKQVMEKARADALQAIAMGLTLEAASAYAGIDRDTLRLWRRDDPEFTAAYMRAEDAATLRHELPLVNADDWRAHAQWLERRRRADWGKSEKIEASGELVVKIVRE